MGGIKVNSTTPSFHGAFDFKEQEKSIEIKSIMNMIAAHDYGVTLAQLLTSNDVWAGAFVDILRYKEIIIWSFIFNTSR